LERIIRLLRKANFVPLTQREAAFAFREDYLLTVPVHVQWDQLDKKLLNGLVDGGEAKEKLWEHGEEVLVFHRGMSLDVTRGQLLWEKIDVLVERIMSVFFSLARFIRTKVLPRVGINVSLFGRKKDDDDDDDNDRPEILDITRGDCDAGEAVELKRVRLQSQVLNPANFLQETTVQEPAFEELFVLWRPKETSDSVTQLRLTGHSASKGMSNLIMVRAVKGVPMADLEIALPEKKLHMKAFDLIQLVISITMAVIALLTQLLRGLWGKNDGSDSASSFVVMSAFALITKTVSTYFASMARYNTVVLSGMNARTMAADRCALTFLVNAVRGQEYAEAASALCVLLQMEQEGIVGPEEKDIATRADEIIARADPDREARPVPCHLEVPDALQKLRRLGLVDDGTKLAGKNIAGTIKILENYLQKQFQSVADGSN